MIGAVRSASARHEGTLLEKLAGEFSSEVNNSYVMSYKRRRKNLKVVSS